MLLKNDRGNEFDSLAKHLLVVLKDMLGPGLPCLHEEAVEELAELLDQCELPAFGHRVDAGLVHQLELDPN